MKRKQLKLTTGWTDATITTDADTGKTYTDSLYSKLKEIGKLSVWRKIKEDLFKKEGRKCWICGAKNVRLNAHEFWKYTPIGILPGKGIKKLVAIHHLCVKCHSLKHFDRFYLTSEMAENWIDNLLDRWKNPEKYKREFLKKIYPKKKPSIYLLKQFEPPSKKEQKAIIERIRKKVRLTEELIEHFCKVNYCSRKVFEKHWEKVQRRKREIQDHQGIQVLGAMAPNYGKYEDLLESCYKEYWKKKKGIKKKKTREK